jgi:hypothetical protein
MANRSLDSRLEALRKILDDMVLNVSRIQDLPVQPPGPTAARTDEMSENSIFLAGIPAIRDWIGMLRIVDQVYVVSCFLREL